MYGFRGTLSLKKHTNISIPRKKIYNKKKIASDLDGVIDENKQLKEIEADEQWKIIVGFAVQRPLCIYQKLNIKYQMIAMQN